jgi:hypothetical protein
MSKKVNQRRLIVVKRIEKQATSIYIDGILDFSSEELNEIIRILCQANAAWMQHRKELCEELNQKSTVNY